MSNPTTERSVADTRKYLAEVINDAIQGQITYITSRGRRVAAVVPLEVAQEAEAP